MKKLLSFLFIIAFYNCNAGTGYAGDGALFMVSILVILLLFLAAGYFIDFLKSRIKAFRIKRLQKQDSKEHEDEVYRFA